MNSEPSVVLALALLGRRAGVFVLRRLPFEYNFAEVG